MITGFHGLLEQRVLSALNVSFLPAGGHRVFPVSRRISRDRRSENNAL